MSITITINDLSALDAFLSSRSFFEGVEATSADVAALAFVGSNVDAAKYPNVARWAAHIRAVQEKKKPKNAKISVAVSGGAAAAAAPAKTAAPAEEEDIDLFGEETEEEAAAKEKLKQDAAAKKEEKKGPITKSSIIFDIKPWEADQDLRSLEQKIRDSVQMEGLHWGVGKLEDVAFGIKKLQMICTIVDHLVSADGIEEGIMQFEDEVQSVDIAAWNKI